MPGFEIGRDGLKQRGRLHRRDEVIEEALLVALEGAPGRGLGLPVQGAAFACDVGGFERRFQILVNDLKSDRR